MSKRVGWWLGVASIVTLLAVACGGDEPTPTATPPPAATATPTAAEPSFDERWAELRAAAIEEGTVNFFVAGRFSQDFRKHLPAVQDALGIEVSLPAGASTTQQIQRVEAERAAGQFTVDVWKGGGSSGIANILKRGWLVSMKDLLFHPEVLDETAFYPNGPLLFLDDEKEFIAPYAMQASTASISYNTDLVPDPTVIQSWYDLLKPEWRGKIISKDPRLGGSQGTVFGFFVDPALGKEFLKQLLTETDMTFVADARTAVDRLAVGEFALCIFACSSQARPAAGQGLPVAANWPFALKEGASVSSGGSSIWTMNNAPHPAAQQYFINWWFTKEGQILMQKMAGNDGVRIDIPKDDVDEDDLRRAGVDYKIFEIASADTVSEAVDYMRQIMNEAGY